MNGEFLRFSVKFNRNRCWSAFPQFIPIILIIISTAKAQERAKVEIRASGACSHSKYNNEQKIDALIVYLHRKGIELSSYRPKIRFNPDRVRLWPKNPLIPGCIRIQAEGVQVLKPIKNLVAEIEIRISGSPDPRNPPIPCMKNLGNANDSCTCPQVQENSCLFCDFCKQMRLHTPTITQINGGNQRKKISVSGISGCDCEALKPGVYDIETEICTPDFGDFNNQIPDEICDDLVGKRPISMFITVYLMDLQRRDYESYLSVLGRAILRRRQAQSTVACFLIGTDVNVDRRQ